MRTALKVKICLFLATLLAASLAAAIARLSRTAEWGGGSGNAPDSAAGRAGEEGAGRPAPRRIVSLAPNVTEMLFLVGAGGRLVGATDYCNYPPEAARIPRIGGYINPNLEAILAAAPDLIVGSADGTPADFAARLRGLGKNVLIAAIEKVADVPKAIREIGAAVGEARAAEEKASAIEAAIHDFERIPADWRRPRVLLCYSLEPIIAAGPRSFGDDLVRLAGGENVAGGAKGRYPQISLEAAVAAAPEAIVIAGMLKDDGGGKRIRRIGSAFWDRWPELPAVRNGCVYEADGDLFSRPGPRLVEAVRALRDAMAPAASGGSRKAFGSGSGGAGAAPPAVRSGG